MKKLLCKLVAKMVDFVEDRSWVYTSKVGKLGNQYYVYNKAHFLDVESSLSVRPFGFVKLGLYVPVITINSRYERLFTKEEMEFAIYHELGHCKYNHFKTKGRHIEFEIEADTFAMNKVGKDVALSALNKLNDEGRSAELITRIYECTNN